MNKIIDGVNYQYIDGYNNNRVTGYFKLEINEVLEHENGKNYKVYLKQKTVTYYKGSNGLSLSLDPNAALQHIKSTSSLFNLITYQRLKELDKIDERVNLLTWQRWDKERRCIKLINKSEYEYLISRDELQGHIQYIRHDKPLYNNHEPFNHPKLGIVYYESNYVYDYQPDMDLKGNVINISDEVEVLDYDNQSLAVNLTVQAMQQLLQETKN
jgi:hypothetical protein